MPTLVANIGTSDIAVKVGGYYLPLGFDRQEPNLEEPNAATSEGEVWRYRRLLLSDFLNSISISVPKLGLEKPLKPC